MLGADGEQVHRWESIIQSEENVLKTVNERRQVLIYLFISFLSLMMSVLALCFTGGAGQIPRSSIQSSLHRAGRAALLPS